MKTLIYTFRTFPYKDQLPESFVFGALKADTLRFEEQLLRQNWGLVLGIANRRKASCSEYRAVNKFNNGVITAGGQDEYLLDVIEGLSFQVHYPAWTTFCNYAAYKVAEVIAKNNLATKHSFVHINQIDLPLLKDILVKQG